MGFALVFPGQGSQYVGMGYDFYREFPESADVFHVADRLLKRELSELIFRGKEEELSKTQNTQPAILTVSVAILKAMEKLNFPKPSFVAGHSLGEYSALVCAKSLDFESALRLVERRATFMQSAVPEGKGLMGAIINLSFEEVEKVCKEASKKGKVEPANYNSPKQVVISGEREAVLYAFELAKRRGGKAIPLKVSVPSHCSLMKEASEAFSIPLAQTPIRDAQIPVVQNYTAKEHTKANEIRENLKKQLYSPVRWAQSVLYMFNRGVRTFVEVGPKKVLTKLIKQTVPEANTLNLEKVEDLEKVLKALK